MNEKLTVTVNGETISANAALVCARELRKYADGHADDAARAKKRGDEHWVYDAKLAIELNELANRWEQAVSKA